MTDLSIAHPRTKADILQIMAGLSIDADLIGEPILANFLMLGVEGAKLPMGIRKRLVNWGFDVVRSVGQWAEVPR